MTPKKERARKPRDGTFAAGFVDKNTHQVKVNAYHNGVGVICDAGGHLRPNEARKLHAWLGRYLVWQAGQGS